MIAGAVNARILTVCTGNICRSPMAASFLQAGLEGLPIVVESAGTGAMDGYPATEQTIDLTLKFGGHDPAAHRSRLLTDDVLGDVDLVFAMSREHRSSVVAQRPSLTRRVFTIREFAALATVTGIDAIVAAALGAGEQPRDRLRAVAEMVSLSRGRIPFADADLDVIDPYRRSQPVYDQAASEIVPAAETVVTTIRAAMTGRIRQNL